MPPRRSSSARGQPRARPFHRGARGFPPTALAGTIPAATLQPGRSSLCSPGLQPRSRLSGWPASRGCLGSATAPRPPWRPSPRPAAASCGLPRLRPARRRPLRFYPPRYRGAGDKPPSRAPVDARRLTRAPPRPANVVQGTGQEKALQLGEDLFGGLAGVEHGEVVFLRHGIERADEPCLIAHEAFVHVAPES